jgi:plasmid stabilization system protein ParE
LKYNPIVKEEAQEKFNSQVEFLARVSETASINLLREYVKSLNNILENPHSCLKYKHKTNKNLKYKLFYKRQHRIVFETVDNNVYIYDIQDCRQDKNKNLL